MILMHPNGYMSNDQDKRLRARESILQSHASAHTCVHMVACMQLCVWPLITDQYAIDKSGEEASALDCIISKLFSQQVASITGNSSAESLILTYTGGIIIFSHATMRAHVESIRAV